MQSFKNRIPFLLVWSRVPIALLVLIIGLLEPDNYAVWIVFLMILGLLTDVFDGIIARKLNISTEGLRVLDSNVDQFFWLLIIGTIFYLNWIFIKAQYSLILGILAMEVLAYMISFFKFKRTLSTHSILAKFWTISLLVFLIDLCINHSSYIAFYTCIILGFISRLEIILIILKLKKWQTDVPSIWVVGKINRGEQVKKNILFNS